METGSVYQKAVSEGLAWHLEDCEELHRQSERFELPPHRNELVTGDSAKVVVDYPSLGVTERVWLMVLGRMPGSDSYIGVLDNRPLFGFGLCYR